MATDRKICVTRYKKLQRAIHGIFRDKPIEHVGFRKYKKLQTGIHNIFCDSAASVQKK